MGKALNHQGDYLNNPAFAEFSNISATAFQLYHEQTRSSKSDLAYADVLRRMTYVAETSSTALRLNASWALTLPAFSLARDRYEQTARFSWLVRQPAYQGWVSLLAGYELTKDRIKRGLKEKRIDPEVGIYSELDQASGETRKQYKQWSDRPFDQVVTERDQLQGITDTEIDAEKLIYFYESIYRQGSSVSHFNLYSVNMLGLYKTDDGSVLAADPQLPIVLVLHNALFDIIFTAEACAKMGVLKEKEPWIELLNKHRLALRKTIKLD